MTGADLPLARRDAHGPGPDTAPAHRDAHRPGPDTAPAHRDAHRPGADTAPARRGGREIGADLVPVRWGEREIGAYVAGPAGTTFRPAVDATRIATTAIAGATVAAVAAAVAVAVRRRPAVGAVTMGPGGWVSVKGTRVPPLRDGSRRPWWARLLRARRLVATR